MDYPALLLSLSESSIADIAADCGIENLSHFDKKFRSVYGTPRRQYRKHHRLDPIQPGLV